MEVDLQPANISNAFGSFDCQCWKLELFKYWLVLIHFYYKTRRHPCTLRVPTPSRPVDSLELICFANQLTFAFNLKWIMPML